MSHAGVGQDYTTDNNLHEWDKTRNEMERIAKVPPCMYLDP
jgi:hypothetical protein